MNRAVMCAIALGTVVWSVSAMPFPGKVGVNLGDVPLVDLVKQTNGYSSASGGAMSPADYDSKGWPNKDFRLTLLDSRPVAEWSGVIDDPESYRADYSGVYKGSFTGQALVSVLWTHGSVSNAVYTASTNTSTFDLTLPAPSSNYCFTVLSFSGTKRTSAGAINSGITNLRILRPGYPDNTTKTFADELIGSINHAEFSVIRAMGVTGTGMMPVVYPDRTTWANRKQLDDASWQAHAGKLDAAPWEAYIDLCNTVDKDIWINIPISADTQYVRSLAQLMLARLNTNRNVYIEIDNEVWGFDSPKNYNAAEATALGLTNPIFNMARLLGNASMTFESVFGAGSLTNRVRPVLAWWIASRNDVRGMLTYIQNNYGPRPPSQIVYGIAPAMYFSVGTTLENNATASQHLLSMAMFQDINNQILSRQQWIQLDTTWHLKGGLLCYEGGPHTPSANTPTAPNLSTKIAMHRSEHMAAQMLYNAREAFLGLGAGLYLHFGLSTGFNRYGCWGITDDLKYPDRNQKFRPIRELTGTVSTPLPPGRFTASIVDSHSVQLTWTDYASNETGFIVELIDSTTGALIGKADTVAANAVSYSDAGLSAVRGVLYHLRAFNGSGVSTYTRAFPRPATSVVPQPSMRPRDPAGAVSALGGDARLVVYRLDGRAVTVLAGRHASAVSSLLPRGVHLVRAVHGGAAVDTRVVGTVQ